MPSLDCSFRDAPCQQGKTLPKGIRLKFRDIDPVKALEEHYGIKQRSYNIILAPLFKGNYGPRLLNEDGTYDIFNIVSPVGMEEDRLRFGTPAYFEHLA